MSASYLACPERTCEENRGFVRMIISRYFPGYKYDDDFFQEAWIGLWEASKRFDENRSVKFNTFATLVIRRRCCNELRRRKRRSRGEAFSLDEHCTYTGLSYIENTPCLEDEIATVTSEIAAGQLLEEIRMSGLTELQLNIMSCRLEGQTLTQIGKNLGICTSNVHHRLKAVRRAAKTLAEKY